MARPRKAPSLAVDGGTPPPPPDDHDDDLERDDDPPLVQLDPPAVDDPGWSRDTVRALVAIPFMGAHLVAKRRGPEDAWLPDDDELAVMADPLHNLMQRSLRLRALARFGDGIAFATATGTYTVAESRRIARWRANYVLEAPPAPDADLSGLGVREAEEPGTERPAPGAARPTNVRAWRPPDLPREA